MLTERSEISSLELIVTHGHTWYGKYGFIPFDANNKITDLNTLVDYRINQRLVNIIPVNCTKLKKYFIDAVTKLNLQDKFPPQKVNKLFKLYETRYLIDFFNDFLKNYEISCGIFYEVYQQIMHDIGMKNLHGTTYYKKIEK